MTNLRRLTCVFRGPRLLAVGLVLFLAHVFANNLRPTPRYVVQTGAKLDYLTIKFCGWLRGSKPHWTGVEHVSDDGRQVIVGVHDGKSRIEIWDARSGTNQTPAHWRAMDWQGLLNSSRKQRDPFGESGFETGLIDLLSHPSGRAFLHDEAAWAALRERLVEVREKALEDLSKTIRPLNDGEGRNLYPTSIYFSPDGLYIAYVIRNGWPLYGSISESLGDGTVIEEARTGRRITMLPGVTNGITIAPGGGTAFAWTHPQDECVYPGYFLWDLKTSTQRAELSLPDYPSLIEYSPDGKYVFANSNQSGRLLWWDTDTGSPVGDVYGPSSPHFMDGGRVLVMDSEKDHVLRFWEVATGRELDDWEVAGPPVGHIQKITFPGGERYLLAEFDPDPGPSAGPKIPVADRVADWLAERLPEGPSSQERRQILVLDAVERRVAGRVPGMSGTLSPNGQWLATLDADGVVRVWHLPLHRPWLRGMGYAVATVLGGWVVLLLPRRLRRRFKSGPE